MYKIENLQYENIIKISNLEITDTNLTFITGESGSGKSTLLKLLHASTYKFSGLISYHNQDITTIDSNIIRKDVGYLSQTHTFFKATIAEEFYYIAQLLNLSVNNELIENYLQICCLALDINAKIELLSGGEKQRLALARLLFSNKQVLILDEPTSSLDESTSLKLIKNLKAYCENKIKLIIVTHNEVMIDPIQDQVIRLQKGVIYDGN